MLTTTSSGLDHPSPSLYVSLTCEFVGRNSNPNSSQGVSNLAVPGIFLTAFCVDICKVVVLVLVVTVTPLFRIPTEMGCWKASENDDDDDNTVVASNTVSMALLSNIMFYTSSSFFKITYNLKKCISVKTMQDDWLLLFSKEEDGRGEEERLLSSFFNYVQYKYDLLRVGKQLKKNQNSDSICR